MAGRYVEVAGPLPEPCWVWQGCKVRNGYGQLTYRRRRWLAHRLSFFLRHGGLSEGDLQIHHACANRACVNPDHLVAATPVENRRAAPTKLDAEKAARIRELGGTLTQSQRARRFGVDESAVGQVLRGVIWREAEAA